MSEHQDNFTGHHNNTDYEFNGSGEKEGGNNSSDSNHSKPKARPVSFGLIELGIFIGCWIAMVMAYKWYNRQQAKSKRDQGWFGPNKEKENYFKLLDSSEEDVEEEVLKKALLSYAMTIVRRMIQLNEEKESIQALGKAGQISPEMLTDFKQAEKEMEMEIFQIQSEAETFKEGWSQEILRDAAKIARFQDQMNAAQIKKQAEEKNRTKPSSESAANNKPELSEDEKKRLLKELLAD